jgi:hypothetical protein
MARCLPATWPSRNTARLLFFVGIVSADGRLDVEGFLSAKKRSAGTFGQSVGGNPCGLGRYMTTSNSNASGHSGDREKTRFGSVDKPFVIQ